MPGRAIEGRKSYEFFYPFNAKNQITGFLLILIGLFLLVDTYRQHLIALDISRQEIKLLLKQPDKLLKHKIPLTALKQKAKRVAIDVHGRRWLVWYRLDSLGLISVSVLAPKGILFIPLLNKEADFKMGRIRFIKSSR